MRKFFTYTERISNEELMFNYLKRLELQRNIEINNFNEKKEVPIMTGISIANQKCNELCQK